MDSKRARKRSSSPPRRRGGNDRRVSRSRQDSQKRGGQQYFRRNRRSVSVSSHSRNDKRSRSLSSYSKSSRSSLLSEISIVVEKKNFIRLSNLSKNVNASVLNDICSCFGIVKEVEFVTFPRTKKLKGVAYV